ncbi:uncharacterized [Tachysurus ichikawai]
MYHSRMEKENIWSGVAGYKGERNNPFAAKFLSCNNMLAKGSPVIHSNRDSVGQVASVCRQEVKPRFVLLLDFWVGAELPGLNEIVLQSDMVSETLKKRAFIRGHGRGTFAGRGRGRKSMIISREDEAAEQDTDFCLKVIADVIGKQPEAAFSFGLK